MQEHVEICRIERSFSGFVDDGLPFERSEFRNDFPARLASGKDASARSGISNSRAELSTAPSFVFRQIRQIGPVPFARVHDVKSALAGDGQDMLDWLDRGPGQREIIAHFVDIPTLSAKVGLHVDDQKKSVLRTQITVVRPTVGIGFYIALFHVRSSNAPGVPERLRLLLQVKIMTASVRMNGEALKR